MSYIRITIYSLTQCISLLWSRYVFPDLEFFFLSIGLSFAVMQAWVTDSCWHQQSLPSENCLNVFTITYRFLWAFALLVSSPPSSVHWIGGQVTSKIRSNHSSLPLRCRACLRDTQEVALPQHGLPIELMKGKIVF